MDYPQDCKVVVLGTTGVGKSCLAVQYKEGTFRSDILNTIGASFMAKTEMVGSKKIKFQIWDTAGQEKYRSLAPMYYRGAAAAILVYDMTDSASFELMKKWVNELEMNGPPDIVMVVVGNKADLPESRQVAAEEGATYAQGIDATFFETSAVTGENVVEVFKDIGSRLPDPLAAGFAGNSQAAADLSAKGTGKKGCC